MSAKKIIAHYQKALSSYEKLTTTTSCWQASEVGVNYSDEERKSLNLASNQLWEAKDSFVKIWKVKIGEAVVNDIHNGKWK
jgi:hypothetical protein